MKVRNACKQSAGTREQATEQAWSMSDAASWRCSPKVVSPVAVGPVLDHLAVAEAEPVGLGGCGGMPVAEGGA
jgi:hypothetical protein